MSAIERLIAMDWEGVADHFEAKPPLPLAYSHRMQSPKGFWVLGAFMGGGMGWVACPGRCQIEVVPALIAVAKAARECDSADRHSSDCKITRSLRPYCNCGHDALRAALAALEEGERDASRH